MTDTYPRNILTLDLGSKTGWCFMLKTGEVRYGMQCFSNHADETNGDKWNKFRSFLTAQFVRQPFQAIYFEDVRRHNSTLSAHAYGGFKAHLESWSKNHNVEILPVPVGVIKKSFTGNGRALKTDMIKCAKDKGYVTNDDNTADAIAIMEYAKEIEC